MITREIFQVTFALVLGVAVFAMPAWADIDHRVDVPALQSSQPVIVQETQPPSADSSTTHRHGLLPESRKAGNLNLERPGVGMDGLGTIANPHATFNSIRPDELQEQGARGNGIPLWRW